MTTAVATALASKYAHGGKIQLSTGTIQRLLSKDANEENSIIMQLTQFKFIDDGGRFSARVKANDGAFEYNAVYFDSALGSQLRADGLESMNAQDCPVLLVDGIAICANIHSSVKETGKASKTPIHISGYKVLVRGVEKIGKPVQHNGNAEEFSDVGGRQIQDSWVILPTNVSGGPTKRPADGPAPTAPPPKAPMAQQQRGPPPAPSRMASSGSHSHITPIKLISPYLNKWRICGKVTAKEELRSVKMRTGDTKVFNFEMTDREGQAIRAAAFGDCAERFYGLVQPNCMYYVSGAGVRGANKKFNTTGHDYELSLNNTSEVAPARDVADDIEITLKINRVPLDQLTKKNGEAVDILACIDKIDEVNSFTSKAGNALTKRDVQLIDESGTVVNLTLWDTTATNFNENSVGQTLAIKGAIVKEFNGGFSLALPRGSANPYYLTPDVPGVEQLLSWYSTERGNVQGQSISATGMGGEGALARDLRFIGTAEALQLGKFEANGTFISVLARITNIKAESALYQACPSEGCQKKVVPSDDQYRCDKCNITTERFKFNFMLQMEISDLSGSIWVTAFGKNAEVLFGGMTAATLGELKNDNPQAYEAEFQKLKFAQRVFRLRAKSEIYNDEERIKYSAYAIDMPKYDKMEPILDGVINKLNGLQA